MTVGIASDTRKTHNIVTGRARENDTAIHQKPTQMTASPKARPMRRAVCASGATMVAPMKAPAPDEASKMPSVCASPCKTSAASAGKKLSKRDAEERDERGKQDQLLNVRFAA